MKETDATSPDGSEVAARAAGAGEDAARLAEWTIMVYMAGNNELAGECVRALTEMKAVKTADRIHVTAQFTPKDERLPTRRFVINLKDKSHVPAGGAGKQPGPSPLAEDHAPVVEGRIRLADEGGGRAAARPAAGARETGTGDPQTLFDFVSWSTQEFPARRYMLVLLGHSAGVEEGYLLKDETPSSAMSLGDFQRALRAVKERLGIELDILGMDTCLMSMVEICYHLRGLTKVLVASQSLVPSHGWPFDRMVRALNAAGGGVDAEAFARLLVNEYAEFYAEYAVHSGLSVDQSALKVDASEGVAAAVKELAEALTDELGKPAFDDALLLSHWGAQSYNGERFVDLYDFCELLKTRYPDEDILAKCEAVQEAVQGLVLESRFCGIDYQYSYGASIYFPWAEVMPDYRRLGFARDEISGWNSFLEAYVEKTRRAPRGGSCDAELESLLVKIPVENYSFSPGHEDAFRKVRPYHVPDPEPQSLFKDDPPWKRNPPDGHGPSGRAHSMRNPPRTWARCGISNRPGDEEK